MLHLLRRPALLLALLLGLLPALRAQTLDPAFHRPGIYKEASVAAAARMPNGQLVVAGNFVRANGQPANNLARFDAAGAADAVFGQNLSGATLTSLSKLVALPNGQLLVVGSYQAGSMTRKYLFRLNADGTLDATFNSTPAIAAAFLRDVLVQPDGRLLVLGTYLTGGNSNPEVLRLLSNGTTDPSFTVALQAEQRMSMQLQADGKILLGGDIRQVNGLARSNVARLNTDGSTDTGYQPAVSMLVTALALDANGSLLVGGETSSTATGQPQSIIRLLNSGALDTSFAFPTALAGRDCKQLAVQTNGQIVVLTEGVSQATGALYSFGSQLTRLQPTGAVDASFQPGSGPDASISEVQVLPTSQLLVTGRFNNFSGERRTVALLQASGALEAGFAPLLQVPGQVTAVSRLSDGRLMLLGEFNAIDGQLTDRVARLLANGQPDPGFVRREPRSARSTLPRLAVQADGKVLLAYTIVLSDYSVPGNTYDNPFVRLNVDGTVDPSFVPALTQDNTVGNAIMLLAEQSPGHIIVGGSDFTDAAGRRNLTRLTATGAVDAGFTPPANQPAIRGGSFVQANGALLCVQDGTGQNTNTLVRLQANGLPDPGFAFASPFVGLGQVRVVQLSGSGDYLLASYFGPGTTEVLKQYATNGTAVASFDSPYTPIATYAFPVNGVRALAMQADGRILVGGFMEQGTATTYPLERLSANGLLDGAFNRSVIPASPAAANASVITKKYYVNDLLVQPDGAIVVAGNFLVAGGQPVMGLVRLLPAGVLATSAGHLRDAAVQVWPVPAHDALHLRLPADLHARRVRLLDALGRTVASQAVGDSGELVLPTAELPRGFYIVRIDSPTRLLTQRIVLD